MDALFDTAVAIVQGLPKSGPIQTDYEDKIGMYSLYKQATVGNVSGSRPPMWDMLGRAKWDAWAKHRNMSPDEAKARYVDSLRKVIRKYPDAEGAKDILKQLSQAQSGLSQDAGEHSDSSGSSGSDDELPPGGFESTSDFVHASVPATAVLPYPSHLQHSSNSGLKSRSNASSSDASSDRPTQPSQPRRPLSMSSSQQRYRTPVGTTLSPTPLPPAVNTPYTDASRTTLQPPPTIVAPSAFATDPSPHHLTPNAAFTPGLPPQNVQRNPPRLPGQASHYRSQSSVTPASHGIERTLFNMQGHLTALSERLDRLESNIAAQHLTTTSRGGGDKGSAIDLSHLGLWSYVLTPIARLLRSLSGLLRFLLGRRYATVPRRGDRPPNPILMVMRRLVLDSSFIFAAYVLYRLLWRKSGGRRKEIQRALKALWSAVVGRVETRVLVDHGV